MHLSPVFTQLKTKVLDQIKNRSFFKVIGGVSLTILLIGGITYYHSTTASAAELMINGQQIGLVQNVNAGQSLIETILKEEGAPYGIAKTNDQITYKYVNVNRADYLNSSLSEEELKDKLSCYLDAYKLEANGSVIAFLPSKDDAQKVLDEYEEYYVKKSNENKVSSVNFAEKVHIEETEVPPDQVKNVDQAYKMLMAGNISTKDYTVQSNDSWWLIARKNNMLTDEVLAGNPGSTKDTKLKPGQIIKIVDSAPFLTVVSQGTYSGSETIPFDVVTKNDSSLGYGQSKVITPGNNGSKLVKYSYVQKNGIDVTKKVLEEKVVQAPVDRVIAKGTSLPSNGPMTVAFAVSRGNSDGASNIVERALSLQGTRYVFGGTSRSGFDCSGFTKYVYAGMGISLPRTSYEQFADGTPVSQNDIRPGDLVFFSTYSSGASHVGIYIGGGRFVEASNPNSGVRVSSLSDSFYSSRYVGARRYN